MDIESSKPRQQRLTVYDMPLHQRKRLVSATLSKDLRKELGKRNVPVVKGDTVKVMRGSFNGKTGKVAIVSLKQALIQIEGVTRKKASGKDTMAKIHPSNVMITQLNKEGKNRFNKQAPAKAETAEKPKAKKGA